MVKEETFVPRGRGGGRGGAGKCYIYTACMCVINDCDLSPLCLWDYKRKLQR